MAGHLISDLCSSSLCCCEREKKTTDGEKVKAFTCSSKSAPYQAPHDWLLPESPGFLVGARKSERKGMNCMQNGQRCIQNCPELESTV